MLLVAPNSRSACLVISGADATAVSAPTRAWAVMTVPGLGHGGERVEAERHVSGGGGGRRRCRTAWR